MGALQKMLDLQEKLQARLGYEIQDMDVKERTNYIKEFSIHLNQEMNEMLYELPYFKPWKGYGEWNYEKQVEQMILARKEFIDAWHFMLNIALALGFTEQELLEEYEDKNKINHERQDGGY